MLKYEKDLSLRASAAQIRAFIETELNEAIEYFNHNELEDLPFHHYFSTGYGIDFDLAQFQLTPQNYIDGFVMRFWDGDTWVHMGADAEREYGCGRLSITEYKKKKQVDVHLSCNYIAYLPYWVWLSTALIRRFNEAKPVSAMIRERIQRVGAMFAAGESAEATAEKLQISVTQVKRDREDLGLTKKRVRK